MHIMWSMLICAIAQQAIDCSEYTAVKVVFVLDKSGSTKGAHYENQVQVANAILDTFRNMTRHLHWGTVTFNSTASVELNMTVDDANRTIVVGDENPSGWTHYEPALGEAKKMIRQYNQTMLEKVTSVKAYIILLTDGVPQDLNTTEKMASFRTNLIKNTTIDIASAFLSPAFVPNNRGYDEATYNAIKYRGLNLLKALSCSNVTSPDCDDHVIQRTLDSENVKQINGEVTRLVGKLVDEKTCTVTEPPILVGLVTDPVTSVDSNASGGTETSKEPAKVTGLSPWLWTAIALAVVAVIAIGVLLLAGVTKKKKALNEEKTFISNQPAFTAGKQVRPRVVQNTLEGDGRRHKNHTHRPRPRK